MFEGTTPDGRTVNLDLDMRDPGLPAGTAAWLRDIGVSEADIAHAESCLQGLWSAWRENGLLRVTGNFHSWLKPEM